jgi:hypothetical protein
MVPPRSPGREEPARQPQAILQGGGGVRQAGLGLRGGGGKGGGELGLLELRCDLGQGGGVDPRQGEDLVQQLSKGLKAGQDVLCVEARSEVGAVVAKAKANPVSYVWCRATPPARQWQACLASKASAWTVWQRS